MDVFKEKWSFAEKEPLIDITKKIRNIESFETKNTVNAAYSDIDVNRHVNNAKYVEWMLDCYQSGFIGKHIPEYTEIDFTGQAVIDDSVDIGFKKLDNVTYFTNVNLNEKDLCRMLITWRRI